MQCKKVLWKTRRNPLQQTLILYSRRNSIVRSGSNNMSIIGSERHPELVNSPNSNTCYKYLEYMCIYVTLIIQYVIFLDVIMLFLPI